MTHIHSPRHRPPLAKALTMSLLLAVSLACSTRAVAGPGAHGPNGEHLDGPPSAVVAASGAPRVEAKSELFELVARLSGGELSIMVDRFATNEPVLNAKVEVESGPLKAAAKFHEDIGDYAIDDPAMLKLLATPGEHPLVITVLAGNETDLLDGVLRSAVPGQAAKSASGAVDAEDHRHGVHRWPWIVGGLAAMFAAIFALRRRKTPKDFDVQPHHPKGGQS